MTYRDANANDLLDCLDLRKRAIADPPTPAAPGNPTGISTAPPPPAGEEPFCSFRQETRPHGLTWREFRGTPVRSRTPLGSGRSCWCRSRARQIFSVSPMDKERTRLGYLPPPVGDVCPA
jgi:hypothetical protein